MPLVTNRELLRQRVEHGELIAGRLDHLLDALAREIGHTRRQTVAAFLRGRIGFSQRLTILLSDAAIGRSTAIIDVGRARIAAITAVVSARTAGVSAIVPVVWSVAVIGAEGSVGIIRSPIPRASILPDRRRRLR